MSQEARQRLILFFALRVHDELVCVIATGIAISLMVVQSTQIAYAQQAPKQKLDKIEITGSSIKQIAQEGVLPITTLSKADIEKTGATSVTDLSERCQFSVLAQWDEKEDQDSAATRLHVLSGALVVKPHRKTACHSRVV